MQLLHGRPQQGISTACRWKCMGCGRYPPPPLAGVLAWDCGNHWPITQPRQLGGRCSRRGLPDSPWKAFRCASKAGKQSRGAGVVIHSRNDSTCRVSMYYGTTAPMFGIPFSPNPLPS